MTLQFENTSIVSPFKEMVAYEAMWGESDKYSFKFVADLFRSNPDSLPSHFISDQVFSLYKSELMDRIINNTDKLQINVLVKGTYDYPDKLNDASEPLELLYYSGNINLINQKGIAIVGSRKPSEKGLLRAEKLTKLLVNDGYTIYSGLAEGIDTMAHKTAIKYGGNTVSVIGTPLDEFYPKQNKDLQIQIAKEHLLISQVPFVKYSKQDYRVNRFFFPERNKTMSALSDATVIIEAGETSGTLIQARAALAQKRKLFILQSCFENPKITWPAKFEQKGAIRVRHYEDIINHLQIG